VLKQSGINCDFLVGAQLEGFDTMVQLSDAPVIIIEGDEYLASPIDRRPKFHLYRANIGLISGIAWDHINVFPTFDNYVEQFRLFLTTIEPGGTIIYNQEDEIVEALVVKETVNLKKEGYSSGESFIKDGITYLKIGEQSVPLLVFGKHNLQNIEAARKICKNLGVIDSQFYLSISTFKGASRRLELLGKNSFTSVYKDFAHSPSKLRATIEAVKEQFPDRQLVAVMELHTFSSLNKDFLNEYRGCIDRADVAVVFISNKTFEHKKMEPYDQNIVKQAFGNDQLNFFSETEMLVEFLRAINYKSKNLLLMSSGNFGGLDLEGLAESVLSD